MAKCERCDKELRGEGVLPTLELKALGLYASERMTQQLDVRTITVTAGVGSAAVPQAFATVGTAPITFNQDNVIQPFALHRLPGRPINAYPLIKDITVLARVTAGTLATPFVLVGYLKYCDSQNKEHVVMPLGLSAATALSATDSSLASNSRYTPTIIIGAHQLGESPIATFGTWRIEGYLTLGTATQVQIDIIANLGIVYGAPST